MGTRHYRSNVSQLWRGAALYDYINNHITLNAMIVLWIMYEIAPLPCKTELPRSVLCLFIHAFLPILGHLHMQPMDQCFLMNVYLSGKTTPRLVQWSGTSNELDAYQPCCHGRWKVILGFHALKCTSMPIQWRGGQGKGKGLFQLYKLYDFPLLLALRL